LEKKSVYLIQANYQYAGSAHIPYAIGMLSAFAQHNIDVNERYDFQKLIFKRELPQKLVDEIINPFAVGFSCYVWNYEYNKVVAKLIKERFPECKIIFGGHHVRPSDEQIKKHRYIDVLIHGEGEEAFCNLLLSYAGLTDIKKISNISYRENEKIFNNPSASVTLSDYPSPYLDGCFDDIIRENPELNFIALLETNRGCPYNCAYCDWGCLSSKLRLFPMERIRKEIDWLCKNKIEICGSTDANFGIIERDETIAEMLADAKRRTGYPIKFQTSYAKNSNDRVFRIGKIFEENGMSKGVTISYQTMSFAAAENVLRKNIPVSTFSDLMSRYNSAGIPTYTELILGLPGETVKSFKEGINELLEAGQHYALYVHNCELLPCSTLASEEFMKKYKISATKIPLNEPHHQANDDEIITEYSRIVTSTSTMSQADWIEMNVFSYLVQGFHHLGLLRYIAVYLYYSCGVRYDDFYTKILEFFRCRKSTAAGGAIDFIEERLKNVVNNNGSLTARDERFGVIDWPFEELLFLRTIYERDEFYKEIKSLIYEYINDENITYDLIKFQKYLIKYPQISAENLELKYDFPTFFRSLNVVKKLS
jgi:radical SAM superfamily enzyme YgiQ (UPF0313 family)